MNYKKILNPLMFAVSAFILPVTTFAQKPVLTNDTLRLSAGDYSVEFSEEGCWTMNWLKFQNRTLLMDTGANQTVVRLESQEGVPASLEWVGTKHGGEQIESLTLIVDGEPYPVMQPFNAPAGSEYTFEKVARYSTMRGTWRVTLTAEGVRQSATFEAVESTDNLRFAYVFMHCWNPGLRQWLAILPDGEERSGEFADPNKASKALEADISALALYSKQNEAGAVVVFKEPYRGINERHNFISYRPRYYTKHYLMVNIRELTSRTYESFIRGFDADAGDWEDVAKSMIASTSQNFLN